VRQLAADLSGRSGPVFAGYLERQLAATAEAAELGARLVRGECAPGVARERMRVLEHQGDRAREDLVGALATALTTPIDRADLFRVSRSVDDVLDNLRDFVREVDLFALPDLAPCVPLMGPLGAALRALGEAVVALGALRPELATGAVRAGKASNAIRRRYDEQLADLLHQPIDGTVLMHRELLRRLDVVGLRIGEAAAALADGYVKRR